MTTPNQSSTIATSQLPDVITGYLTAHQARDIDTAISYYIDDATVIDEGNTYRGRQQISGWLRRSASEYTYTIELTGAQRIDEDHYVALHHLEGDFPGGVTDLRFTFALHEGRIAHLAIEP
ncbi:MAG TPA: nuclear transport factor 2 family protein [Candidatus Dormibacteraeota bacterium]|jgi:ketosteroid isomerase-like protein|nr:nuclear transport factor 2 family protein [Candidatus Dormibacteraeota bacterium]